MNDDGSMARFDDLVNFCKKHHLKMSSIKDLIEYKLHKDRFIKCVNIDEINIPKFGNFKIFIYKSLIDDTEHLALVKGKISNKQNILVRMHRLNILNDVLNIKNKDLEKSLSIISKNNSGIVVIVRNPDKEMKKKEPKTPNSKIKILKEYGIGAQILLDLGVKKIILLTKSSKNIIGIDGFGLEINGTKRF